MAIRPPAVLPGATVGIVAPASPVAPAFLEAGEAELGRIGFRTRRGRNLLARGDYTAGDPDARAADFLDFLEDDGVAALLCARGGYGSLDLLSRIPPERLRATPKAILGASDATALLALASAAGVVSFHGPMVAQQIARGPEAWDAPECVRLLAAREPGVCLPWRGAEMLHPGRAEGVVRGGCLSLVAALAGTPFAPRFAGAIALFEDIAVKPYQLERMLAQLALADLLEGVRGIVFGQMPGCAQHPDQGYTLEGLLTRLTAPLGVPVAFGFATGHTDGAACRTLPLETRVRMDEAGLTLLEGAVS